MMVVNTKILVTWLWAVAAVVSANPKLLVAGGKSTSRLPNRSGVNAPPTTNVSDGRVVVLSTSRKRGLQDSSNCSSQLNECKTVLQQTKNNCQPETAAVPATTGLLDILLAILRLILDFLLPAFRNCAADLEKCTGEVDNFVCTTNAPPTEAPVVDADRKKVPAPAPVKAPVVAPIKAPVKAPAPAPIKAPVMAPAAPPPIKAPATAPVAAPVKAPVVAPAPAPTPSLVTTFYAIGDVPYTASEAPILAQQMAALPNDAAFLIHVGDIRRDNDRACEAAEFSAVATILVAGRNQ